MTPPEITHLGMVSGEWPVMAFTSESHAAHWAAAHERRYVWAVASIELGPPLHGRAIPERYELAPRAAPTLGRSSGAVP
jgi:hypothetical protein